jgi:bifunctional non-homologous end joining protein LigD
VPSFQRLQKRLHVNAAGATVLAPVHLALFDVLWLDGRSTVELPWSDRRELLEGLHLTGGAWRTPPVTLDDPGPLVQLCRERGLEGVMAKRTTSRYLPGRRSPEWVKIPLDQRDELVVGGWMPGQRGRTGRLGSLLVGRYEGDVLRYAGRVGTGFDADDLEHLARLFAPLRRDAPPFGAGDLPKGAVWVDPEVVVAVKFRTWTDAGIVRHASFLGVRDDVPPR